MVLASDPNFNIMRQSHNFFARAKLLVKVYIKQQSVEAPKTLLLCITCSLCRILSTDNAMNTRTLDIHEGIASVVCWSHLQRHSVISVEYSTNSSKYYKNKVLFKTAVTFLPAADDTTHYINGMYLKAILRQ